MYSHCFWKTSPIVGQDFGTTVACSLNDHHYAQYHIDHLTIDLHIAQKV